MKGRCRYCNELIDETESIQYDGFCEKCYYDRYTFIKYMICLIGAVVFAVIFKLMC